MTRSYTKAQPPASIWIDTADLRNLESRGCASYFLKPYEASDGPSDGESIKYVRADVCDELLNAARDAERELSFIVHSKGPGRHCETTLTTLRAAIVAATGDSQ